MTTRSWNCTKTKYKLSPLQFPHFYTSRGHFGHFQTGNATFPNGKCHISEREMPHFRTGNATFPNEKCRWNLQKCALLTPQYPFFLQKSWKSEKSAFEWRTRNPCCQGPLYASIRRRSLPKRLQHPQPPTDLPTRTNLGLGWNLTQIVAWPIRTSVHVNGNGTDGCPQFRGQLVVIPWVDLPQESCGFVD
jgi:hypothetical protein